MSPRTRLCVALDSADPSEIRRIASATSASVDMYKTGLTAFAGNGPEIVTELAAMKPVFLDLKLHDIPVQVAGAVAAAIDTGATLITVHASGGPAMIAAAVEAAAGRVEVLAVTILTSLDDAALAGIGIAGPTPEAVARLATLAVSAGADGLVCSPLEVGSLRTRFGSSDDGGPTLVVPGIRPGHDHHDDQRRTLSAREASGAGADVIVVGRPITAASDPGAAARAIAQELEESAGAVR